MLLCISALFASVCVAEDKQELPASSPNSTQRAELVNQPSNGGTFEQAKSQTAAAGPNVAPADPKDPKAPPSQVPANTPTADISVEPLSPTRPNAVMLNVDECIEIAVQNNLGLRINRINDREVDITVRTAWAQYFPEFSTGILHTNQTTGDADITNLPPPAAPTTPTTPASKVPQPEAAGVSSTASAGTNSFTGGVTQRSPYGTTLDFSVSEARNSFDRHRASGDYGVNLTQPLWKGASLDVGLKNIRQSRIRRLISRGSLELDTQSLIFNVRQAYANIIRQKQNLDVDNQAVVTAKTFLDLTAAREAAGQVTKLDVSNAEVQLQNRRLSALQDRQALEIVLDTLKNLMDVDLEENIGVQAPVVDFGDKFEEGVTKELIINREEGTVSLEIRKNNQLVGPARELFRAQRYDESVILDEALQNRIDLLNSRRAVAVQKLETAASKNGLGHEIDLVGSYSRGLSGHSVFEGDNGTEAHSWSYGVNAKFPWGKIVDRGIYENALLELERTEIELKQARTIVQTDVRNILRNIRVAEESLLIQGQQVEQAKRSAEAAQISFERGLQSSFDVINAENALLAAKRGFINSRLDYLVFIAQLEVVVGKPTGRVNLEGQSVGGLIDSHIPEELRDRGLPQRAPDAKPDESDNPWNKTRLYRKDYSPDRRNPVSVDQGR
jgi:outer membrane protein TolC